MLPSAQHDLAAPTLVLLPCFVWRAFELAPCDVHQCRVAQQLLIGRECSAREDLQKSRRGEASQFLLFMHRCMRMWLQ